MQGVKYEKIIDLTEDMICEDLREPIGRLYERYQEKMKLPQLENPREQLECLEQRKIVTGMLGKIQELNLQNEGEKFRLFPYQLGIENIKVSIELLLE